MVCVRTFADAGSDTAQVLGRIEKQVDLANAKAHCVFTFFGCRHDGETIRTFLATRFPTAAILGGTSKSGLMTDAGLLGDDAIGILTIEDAEGQYGAAVAPLTNDPAAAAETALKEALRQAKCPGELPALIWVYVAPGREETVLEGFRRVVGDRCPVTGGSAADEGRSGLWCEIATGGTATDGIAVAALFPSGDVETVFQGGFEATERSGIVTQVRGREIFEIDGRRAADVYNEWTDGLIGAKAKTGGLISPETAMFPLGIEIGEMDGVPNYLLIHPKLATAEGSIVAYALVDKGVRLHLMRGDKIRLAERAGLVATQAVANLRGGESALAGAVMHFCAGCQGAVWDSLPAVAADIAKKLDRKPFLLSFTYGEVGCLSERNIYGNMMISAAVFGR
jgi:hypothetical protein